MQVTTNRCNLSEIEPHNIYKINKMQRMTIDFTVKLK